jgi:hypothetical protein
MPRFKLLVGQHVAADPADIERAREEKRPPRDRVYRAGETIDTEEDLSKLNAGPGMMKFERLEDPPRQRARGAQPMANLPPGSEPDPRTGAVFSTAPATASAAPGGQVGTGFQEASGTPLGTISGPMNAPAQEKGFTGTGTPRAPGAREIDRAREGQVARERPTGVQGTTPQTAKTPPPPKAEGEEPPPGGSPPPPSPESPSQEWTEEELNQMTVPELRELAEEEEVDLKGASRKDEIVRAILKG